MRRAPCRSCPWRVDAEAGDIPNFSLELAEGLACTSGETSIGQPMFACHQSTDVVHVVCVGWLARHGWDNLTVRINLMNETGIVTREQLDPPPEEWGEIHTDYPEMMDKLRRTA